MNVVTSISQSGVCGLLIVSLYHEEALTIEVWIKGNGQIQFSSVNLNFLNYVTAYINFIFQNVVIDKEEKIFS